MTKIAVMFAAFVFSIFASCVVASAQQAPILVIQSLPILSVVKTERQPGRYSDTYGEYRTDDVHMHVLITVTKEGMDFLFAMSKTDGSLPSRIVCKLVEMKTEGSIYYNFFVSDDDGRSKAGKTYAVRCKE